MNTQIYFDWSGTLALPRTRNELIKGNANVLYSDTINTLKILKSRGYKLGIISNTKMPRDKFIYGLKRIDLYKYFDKIILSSDENVCRKPCYKIFQLANADLYYGNNFYVGNNLNKDILGAKNNNFIGIHINRDNYLYDGIHPDISIRNLYELIDLI